MQPMYFTKREAIWPAARGFFGSLVYAAIFIALVGGIAWFLVDDKKFTTTMAVSLAILFIVSAAFKLTDDIKRRPDRRPHVNDGSDHRGPNGLADA